MGDLFSRIFAPRPDALTVGEVISRGAYGVVHRGRLGARPVAVKKVHDLLLDCARERKEDLEATLKSFHDECEIMKVAKHSNVVEYIGVFHQEESALLVMELMDQTLADYLANSRGPLPLSKQAHICLQIAQGLTYLHEHTPQILHRDLTAKNVLVKEDGSIVKISDLGQAKFRPSSVLYLTTKAPGCVVYMPPECLVDRPHFTDRSDMFSFGVVVLQVTTQEPPSVGLVIREGQPETERRAADLSRLRPDHPMRPLILQCLQNDPAQRPWCREALVVVQAITVKNPFSERRLGSCQKVIRHSMEGGVYRAVAVSSEGLLAVSDWCCVHLITKEGALLRSIGEGVFGGWLFGVAFDLKGNVWVTDWSSNIVFKLSQDGRLLQTIDQAIGKCFHHPYGVSVSPEGLIYICDWDNHRVTVHDDEGNLLFVFGSQGSGRGCLDGPRDIAFGSNGLLYVVDSANKRVSAWSKKGTFKGHFKTKYDPTCIAATSGRHLVITSANSHTVMVYTLGGQLVYGFGGKGCELGRFNGPFGICVDDNGLVCVVDMENSCVQVF